MKILFVAMAHSVHTVRWIEQLNGTGWDLHVFPTYWPCSVRREFRDITVQGGSLWRPEGLDASVTWAGAWPFRRGAYRVEALLRHWPAWSDRAKRLARTIRRVRPDFVHALEMQGAGYLTLEASRHLGDAMPPWIYSSWGSDIFFFGRQDAHRDRIRAVLGACNYHIADCRRDVALVRDCGFRGKTLGVFPVGGGYDLSIPVTHGSGLPPSRRRTIAVKGYQNDHLGGRALVALKALHLCADVLSDYEIVVYLAEGPVRAVAEHMACVTGLRVTIMPYSSHEDILGLFGRSRLAIGLGTTDGSPSSLLEAMIMGACPVQSDTVSTGEWIENGVNGFLVPPEDPVAVAHAIRRALADDMFVDAAAGHNATLAGERLDRAVIQAQVRAMYAGVLTGKHGESQE